MQPRLVVLLIAGVAVLFIGIGVRSCFGLFLTPMSIDLGWGRETFAFAIAVQNIVWGLSQPMAGAIADRYGAGRVVVVCVGLYVAGLYLMSGAATPFDITLSNGLLMGLGMSGLGFPVILAVVGRAVIPERRSLYLGLVSAGGSAGQVLMVPLGQGLISAFGWEYALLCLAALLAIVVPLAALTLASARVQRAPTGSQSLTDALREARGHSGYWYLTAGFFVCGFHVTFMLTHLPSYLVDQGANAAYGAIALSLIGLGNIVGTAVCGVLGGRYRKKFVLSVLYILRAVVMTAFLVLPMTPTTIVIFSLSLGLLWLGTVPLTSGLVADIFGVKYMATLFGFVFFSHQMGAFAGAWLGGYVFDMTGSYQPVWVVGIVLGVVSALLHWPIRDEPVERLQAVAA